MEAKFFSKYFLNEKNNFLYGFIFFNIGIFLLASAPFLGAISILISMIISLSNDKSYLNIRNKHFFFLTSSILLISIALIKYFFKINYFDNLDNSLNFVGLFNWVPFLISFYLMQPYLKKYKYRKLSSFLLISGSFPIIIIGLGQYFLGWENQLSTLNGNIIWFLKPINELKGLSAIFNNPNYAGSWLSMIWPISIVFFLKNKRFKYEKIIYFIFSALILYCVVLTNSKDTLIAIFIPLFFLFKFSIIKYLLLTIIFLFFIYFISSNATINIFQKIFVSIINPHNFIDINWSQLTNIFPRIDIWRVSILAILEKPILGWGVSSFPFIYSLYKYSFINDKIQHSHNLFFELSINYGLFASLIIFGLIIKVIVDSSKIILKKNKNKNILDKAWWLSVLIFLFNHMFDVTYYDIRISLLFWVMLSGLKCILEENKESQLSI